MDSLHVLANLYAQSSLHRTAYSAMPDAPVQPVVPRRRPLHTIRTAAQALAHRRRHSAAGVHAAAA